MTLLSDHRDASGRDVGTGGISHSTDLTDAGLLAAVRAGDTGAYATLYSIHAEAVRRLARRLCRDRHEADDVVSEVFANTLRAIQHGGGPRDEFGLYALRSVRNTVTKLRTRTDTARATPSEIEVLDRPSTDDPYLLAGDVEQAFAELPQRFRDVLWTTAVEGRTPAELAALGDTPDALDAGGFASLSQRARKALGRSYLRVRTSRPARLPDCNPVRAVLPGYVQHTASVSTAHRVEAHLALCADCTEIRDEMRDLNGKLRTTPWLALLAAAIRRAVAAVTAAGVPAAATAVAPVVALVVAGTIAIQHDDGAQGASDNGAAVAFDHADQLPAPGSAASRAAVATPDGSAGAATGEPAPAPAGSAVLPVAGPSADQAVAPPAETTPVTPAPVDTITGPPRGGPQEGPATWGPGTTDTTTTPLDGTEIPGAVDTVTDQISGGGELGGVVGGVTTGVTTGVLPAATTGVGTLVDDLGRTVDDLGTVVGALPGGLPAVLTGTGELVDGVGTTVGNLTGTVGQVAGATTATVVDTVGTLGDTVDQTTTDLADTLGTTLEAVAEPDPAAPLGAVDAALTGAGSTVGNLLGGLLGPAPTPTTPTAPCTGLLCALGG